MCSTAYCHPPASHGPAREQRLPECHDDEHDGGHDCDDQQDDVQVEHALKTLQAGRDGRCELRLQGVRW